jgi:sortase A
MCRLPGLDQWRGLLALLLLLLCLQQAAGAALIHAKAWLAPVLLEQAWQRTLSRGGGPQKPWPWADTWPVARLRAPLQAVDLLVLAGDSGNALAFGPGHASASAQPGSQGRAVIAGHRDTHFAFLRKLRPGDPLQLQLPRGGVRHYRVAAANVVDATQQQLQVDDSGESLLLVTCYPFDALLSAGSLRYTVSALPSPLLAAQPAPVPMARQVFSL